MSIQPVVYVVDDDPAVNRLLTEVVKGIEMHVETYGSAEEFLEVYHGTGPGLSGLLLFLFQEVLSSFSRAPKTHFHSGHPIFHEASP